MDLKRLLAAVLTMCLMIGLCACANGGGETATTTAAATESGTVSTTQSTTQPTTQPAVAGGYVVKVVDEGGNPIAGAFVQLCLDTCFPGVTDSSGVASFQVEEADYKVSFVNLPAGYAYSSEVQEFYFADGETELTIVLKAVS